MNIFMKEMPHYINKEIEQMQKIIAPLMKKVSKYAIWTLPLMGVSFINLVVLLFFGPVDKSTAPTILIFAVLGAVGLALLKEVKIQRKEMEKLAAVYIIERIKKSEVASEYSKKEYITQIKAQPDAKALNLFILFLKEENDREQMVN